MGRAAPLIDQADIERCKVGDVCELLRTGVNPSRFPEEEFELYSIPAFDDKQRPEVSQGSKIKSNKTLIEPDVVLFSKLNPRINRVWCVSQSSRLRQICTTEFVALKPDQARIIPDYLMYACRAPHVIGGIRGTTSAATKSRERVNPSAILALEIRIPSISEQHRIVDILKRSDSVRRLRKQAQDTARQLIPALFVDMFGDPAKNPRGLAIRKVSDFVERFEGGKNLKPGSETPDGVRILKVSAVTLGTYDETESKPAPDGYTPPKTHYVREGDLLFSRANTEALVGATALVHRANGNTLLPDKIWRFVWSEEVEPMYFYALFQSSFVRQRLSKLSTGTSASMKNISQGKLKMFKLPVASYKEQKIFSQKAQQAQAIISHQLEACKLSNMSFQSLLHRVFNVGL